MKKLLPILLLTVMVLSFAPLTVSARFAVQEEGMWATYRPVEDYEEPEEGEEHEFKLAPGYEYTDEGFRVIPADYSFTTPFGTLQSKDKQLLWDGFYMELRIDDFSYTFPDGILADHWIAFSLSSHAPLTPATTRFGNHWVAFVSYDPQSGKAQMQVGLTVGDTEECPGSFTPLRYVEFAPEVDSEGRLLLTWGVTYADGNYAISICDTVISADADNAYLNTVFPEGYMYVGVSFHSAVEGGTYAATMTGYGRSAADCEIPQGSDSQEPEQDFICIYPFDPEVDTLPAEEMETTLPVETVTQADAEAVTEYCTEALNKVPPETSTDTPIEAPTEAPVEAVTEGQTIHPTEDTRQNQKINISSGCASAMGGILLLPVALGGAVICLRKRREN